MEDKAEERKWKGRATRPKDCSGLPLYAQPPGDKSSQRGDVTSKVTCPPTPGVAERVRRSYLVMGRFHYKFL